MKPLMQRVLLLLPAMVFAAQHTPALAQTTLAAGSAPDIPWVRLIFSFLFCIGVAIGAVLLLRRYQQRGGSGLLKRLRLGGELPVTDQIRILEARRVSPSGRLCVIEFDGRQFLLSVTDHTIAVLAEKNASDPSPVNGQQP